MDFPRLPDVDISGKKVLARLDLDVGDDDSRVETAKKTLNFLAENKAKTIIIGHKGRPSHKAADDESLYSLEPISKKLSAILGKKVKFIHDIVGLEAKHESDAIGGGEFLMLENLRFDSREEANDESFAKSLASLADFYVNEAFAASHRRHASIIGVPQFLAHAAGFHFASEVENLNKVLTNPKRPVVAIVSGVKEDKVKMAGELTKIADKVLVGGRLPEYFGDEVLKSVKLRARGEGLVIGNLTQDKEDITLNTIDVFKGEIEDAGTIVLAGVLGKYEDEGHRQGTKEIFAAVAASSAFKVAGGGDTEAALTMFGLTDKFDWISVGGGAMLEFLINRTLPGIKALEV